LRLTRSGALFIVGNTQNPTRLAGVPNTLLIAILAAGLFGVAFAVFGSRLLFDWYLHEVRGMSVIEEPGEAIVTYPLA
jgi:hypothetical protein